MQEHRDSQTPAGHRKLRVRHRMCKRSPPGPRTRIRVRRPARYWLIATGPQLTDSSVLFPRLWPLASGAPEYSKHQLEICALTGWRSLTRYRPEPRKTPTTEASSGVCKDGTRRSQTTRDYPSTLEQRLP